MEDIAHKLKTTKNSIAFWKSKKKQEDDPKKEVRAAIFTQTNNYIDALQLEKPRFRRWTEKELLTEYEQFNDGSGSASSSTQVRVKAQDCLEAAQEIATSNPGVVPFVINMANLRYIGGGYKRGDGAQEETLIRRTTLIRSLLQAPHNFSNEKGAHYKREKYKYDDTVKDNTGFGHFNVLESQNVTVLRKSEDNNHSFLEEKERFTITVGSVAAFDLRETPYNKASVDYQYKQGGSKADDYEKDTKRKIQNLLTLARIGGHKHLVLSALGCGAFKNPPETMAQMFKEVLQDPKFANYFESVVFAIVPNSGHDSDPNFDAFNQIFNPSVVSKPT